jgi:acetyl-CoA acetyltransferase
MASRNPSRDQVAIVGVYSKPYQRNRGMSENAMAVEACIGAIRDAGLEAADIDGVCGSTSIPAQTIASCLRLPALSWWANVPIPFTAHIIEAVGAVASGVCDSVLAYHSTYRGAGVSRSAAGDPFRSRKGPGFNVLSRNPDTVGGAVGYAAWASRYLHEYGAKREHFGLVAINDRTNAGMNEHAAIREPLTMEDYLSGRMIRDPLTIFDMDYPVDGADAFVITTVERARDLAKKPVLVHAATLGMTGKPDEDQMPDLRSHGQQVVAENLWKRSEVTLKDCDIFFPYDGFTVITLGWFEAMGYCDYGEAGPFLEENWDADENRLKIGGRMLVNPHGGSLSDGGTQGVGHIREAVLQLRGEAEGRQAQGVKTALITPGGFFFNAGGLILRTDG